MASVAQAGRAEDELALTKMITNAAQNAATYSNCCKQLAEHVGLIGNLLEILKSTDLIKLPAMAEPMALLEKALKRALNLVESCRDKSYLFMLAMGWSVVYQFRQYQYEIDSCLKLPPLISLAHEFRIQNVTESLEGIEEDHRVYTLDEEDFEARIAILKPDRSKKDAKVLEKSLSRRYPNLEFREALQEETEKLQHELLLLQEINDPKLCRLTEHLIDVTQNVVNVSVEKNLALNLQPYIGTGWVSSDGVNYPKSEDQDKSEWQADLFDCSSEPCLSLKACIYPCGIFSMIANVVSSRKITREQALSDMMAYSLFCGCCCYTCCIRRKLRQLLNIEGSSCDDFLTHLMCCCCAMIQEWRELELRGFEGWFIGCGSPD